ncbi:MAG: isoleucine--tRNA ligase [Clostridia bacterium]|nr:isoleucine--tRNA ligase [Clostridia bacterium]
MFNKVDTGLDFCSREKEVLDFWKANGIFQASVKANEGKEEYTFYDGPPTANGKPHIGHILTRVIKDIIPRYRTMKGYHVERKAGWDTHGLPVELEVEKMLGMDGKQDIEKYGIEPFVKNCKESVWKYKGEWERMSDRVGYWADMENPYVTYDDNYIESVWWAVKTINDKGLLYKGHKIVPYCPRCGTALSSHEVAQGYKDVEDMTVTAKFKAVGEESTYFLAWTTTPWTLPSNVALCMNAEEDYVYAKLGEETYILAAALVKSVLGEDAEILSTHKGSYFEHKKYLPLFDYIQGTKEAEKAYYVTNDPYVTLTEGTGIVHIAPAFGEDDAKVGRKYGLPFVQLVDERGRFVDVVTDLKGVFAKDGDKLIIEKLVQAGLLFKKHLHTHSYPFCWRCDTPLLYYARSSYFIKMTAVRDNLLKNNATVNWIPPTIGSGRFGNFLENVIDWGVSRERYWGTPLPVWVCDKCGKSHVVGSKAELKALSGTLPSELHRPYIDRITFPCECGGVMKRTPEVMDCWFDSGSMPFAQLHYPFENKEAFEKHFPADFISEAVDQTRGWFYTLMAISTLLFDKAPFKNCIVLGHVGDKDGIKMSKHKGNVVDPWSVLDKQGADAVRWYFYTGSAPWLPSRFYAEAVSEAQRKFMGTFWNTYAFFTLYAGIDDYKPQDYSLDDCKLSLMDRWVLSRLNTLVKSVDDYLADYKITESARMIADFTDELSNWYVRRCRERYWGSEMTEDKAAAYTTLYHVLVTMSRLIAPFVPFMAESVYRNLVVNNDKNAPISVHLTSFPVADEKYIDKEFEKEMSAIENIVFLGRACRNKANIKNRQPLANMFVKTDVSFTMDGMLDIAAEELNVKKVSIAASEQSFISYEIKPQLKTLGPKYGPLLGAIRSFLMTAPAAEIVSTVRAGETYKTVLNGKEVEFTADDLLITTKSGEGYSSESDGTTTVALDTRLTDALIKEGFAREIVSKIQTMRKEAGFEVTDHILLGVEAEDYFKGVIEEFDVCADVLADEVRYGSIEGYTKEYDLNGKNVRLTVCRK